MKRQLIGEIICFLLIFLFSYAAITKLMDVEKFRIQIGQSPLLTDMAGFISIAIPVLELLLALALGFSRFRFIGLVGSLILMIMFTTYIAIIMNFSYHIPCSCGGILQKMNWRDHLIFNIAFVIVTTVGVMLYGYKHKQTQLG